MTERERQGPQKQQPRSRTDSRVSEEEPGLLSIQADAGNAATAALVQRWTKGTGTGAPPDPSWAKGTPSTKAAGTIGLLHRNPQAKAAYAMKDQVALADAAFEESVKALALADKHAASGGEQKTLVAGTKTAAESRHAVAKGMWASEEPFMGWQAAKQADEITKLWTKADGAVLAAKQAYVDSKTAEAPAAAALKAADAAGVAARRVKTAGTAGGMVAESLAAQAAIRDRRYAIKKNQAAIRQAILAAKQAEEASIALLGDVTKSKTAAWAPLKSGGPPAVIIGRLQQQLNATRAKGTERISVTGHFTSRTETLLKAYQGGAATGIADADTWAKLDKAAPAVQQAGQWVVLSPEGAKVMGTTWKGDADFEGMTRPWVYPKVPAGAEWYAVSSGSAVVELQQRLNNWVKSLGFLRRLILPTVKVTGTYDKATGTVLKAFQKDKGLNADGVATKVVWGALEQVKGSVDEGMVMQNELTEVEGQDRGQTIKYVWKAAPGELKIIAKIDYKPVDVMTADLADGSLRKDPTNPAKLHPDEVPRLEGIMTRAIGEWQDDIKRVWNGFTAKDVTPGSTLPPAKLTFVPERVNGGGDAEVTVWPTPTTKNPGGRSDSANWWASDTDAGLAPHEFGHLIGLPDEYSRREGHYVETTGTESLIGSVTSPRSKKSPAAQAQYIATKIQSAAPMKKAGDPADPAKKTAVRLARGKIVAFADAVRDLRLRESAFSRAVSEEFKYDPTAAAVSGGQDIPAYIISLLPALDMSIDAERELFWALQGLYEAPIRAFLVSNQTIMGSMEALPARGVQMPIGHAHPVQSRHLQPYLKHLETAFGGTWKVT